jgi:Icc-related predicted phosphoesterase
MKVYGFRRYNRMMKIVAFSDTHNLHRKTQIPEGDVLIHAGDFTDRGTLEEVQDFLKFFSSLPHPHKILVAGNHDFYFENFPEETEKMVNGFTYLLDEEVVIDGVKFYGTPWQPRFQNWAFNLDRGAEIKAKWDLIPADVDLLVTHGAPYGIRDQTFDGEKIGCKDLYDAVKRIKPPYHLFGHVHEGYGQSVIGETTFVNLSICDMHYQAVNIPTIINL